MSDLQGVIVSSLIGAATTISTGIITVVLTAVLNGRIGAPATDVGTAASFRQTFRNRRAWSVILPVLAGLEILLGLIMWLLFVRSEPTVTINDPTTDDRVRVVRQPNGVVRFITSGNSSDVASNSALKIYVLVRPESAQRWYVQPPVAPEPVGYWSATVWYGSQEVPPQVRDSISLMAIVAKPGDVEKGRVRGEEDPQLRDPRDASPLAQSAITRISIGQISKE